MMATTSPALSAFLAPTTVLPLSATLTAASVSQHASSLHRAHFSAPAFLDTFSPPPSMLPSPSNTMVRADTALSLFGPAFVEPLLLKTRLNGWLVEQQDENSTIVDTKHSLRSRLQVSNNNNYNVFPVVTRRPMVVGHRGALFDELENTRAAFLRCAALGCEAVELDVFLLKDGNLVIFHGGGTDEHPGDLSDYCLHQEGKNILDLTLGEAQQLEFNPAYAEFACPADKIRSAQIPTLEQVLTDLKSTGVIVKIELKGQGVVEPVLELVDRLDMVDQCQYSSFDHGRLALLRQLRPARNAITGQYVYQTGALFDTVPDDFMLQATAVGASEVHLRYDLCTVERVQAIHKAGMGSMAWFRGPIGMKRDTDTTYLDVGNEDFSCYRAVMDTGVQQVCCNRPDVLVSLLQGELPQSA